MKMKEPVTCNRSTCNSPQAITLSIGILFAPAITFRLNGTYWNKDQKYSGEYTISKEVEELDSTFIFRNTDRTGSLHPYTGER